MRPPSVNSLANTLLKTGLPQPLCVDIAREVISDSRGGALEGAGAEAGAGEEGVTGAGAGAGAAGYLEDLALAKAEKVLKTMLQPVVNATGVLLHTNMGRAPYELSQPLAYTNLELDIETGKRSSRQSHIASLFARLTGAEAGLVVNNCAAAVTLILAALAGEGGVVVSRGELVEIGGGFRLPEVIASSGAELIEVGTTNRTRLKDYEKAIKKHSVDVCLKVHQSNYTLKGFSEAVSVEDLKGLGVPLVVDLGSGLLDASCPWLSNGLNNGLDNPDRSGSLGSPDRLDSAVPSWLQNEPAVKQTLEAGADLVAISGDKLLGGPQAGIILGKAELVKKCSDHPLARAFRLGGLSVAALLDVALKYLNRQGDQIPFWKMASLKVEELEARAEAILLKTNKGIFMKKTCVSLTGGGTLPDVEIPSFGIHIKGDVSAQLRQQPTPIVARVQDGNTIIDLRTVFPEQDELLVGALNSL